MTEQERHWFANIPACCGPGDAFVADSFYEQGGKYYAVITDGTDWFYRIKGAVRVGTVIEIPPDMLAAANDPYYVDHPNPTHHGVVFLEVSRVGGRIVNSQGGPPEGAKPFSLIALAAAMSALPPARSPNFSTKVISQIRPRSA